MRRHKPGQQPQQGGYPPIPPDPLPPPLAGAKSPKLHEAPQQSGGVQYAEKNGIYTLLDGPYQGQRLEEIAYIAAGRDYLAKLLPTVKPALRAAIIKTVCGDLCNAISAW